MPDPGGPNSRTPRGIFAPIAWNFAGLARYSLTSWSSSIASSTPATSANVVFGWSLVTSLARALPNCITRPPPPCDWFMMKMNAPTIRITGMSWKRNPTTAEPFCGSAEMSTPFFWSSVVTVSSVPWTYATRYAVPSASSPSITPSPSRKFAVSTLPAAASSRKSLNVIGSDVGPLLANSRKSQIAASTTST